MTGRIILELHIQVAEGRREALLAFLEEAFPRYERPGGIRMSLLEQVDEPGHFIERVAYRDRETFERDQARMEGDPEMRALLGRWRTHLAGPPRVVVHRELLPVPG
jgi:quinol monooxygenase YgiN